MFLFVVGRIHYFCFLNCYIRIVFLGVVFWCVLGAYISTFLQRIRSLGYDFLRIVLSFVSVLDILFIISFKKKCRPYYQTFILFKAKDDTLGSSTSVFSSLQLDKVVVMQAKACIINKCSIHNDLQVQVHIFGSTATSLNLPTADIDVAIVQLSKEGGLFFKGWTVAQVFLKVFCCFYKVCLYKAVLKHCFLSFCST